MITTEQEARAAVAKVGERASRVVQEMVEAEGQWNPYALYRAAEELSERGFPKLAKGIKTVGARWAAARGAAK